MEIQRWTSDDQLAEEHYFYGHGAAEIYLGGFNPKVVTKNERLALLCTFQNMHTRLEAEVGSCRRMMRWVFSVGSSILSWVLRLVRLRPRR